MFKNIAHFILYVDFNLVTIFPSIRPGTSISIFINNRKIYYLRTLSNQGQYLKYNCESLNFLELEVIMNIPDKQ